MNTQPFEPIGFHYLLELFGCNESKLDDQAYVLNCLNEAAGIAESTVIETVSHKFNPKGLTAVLLLKESHLSIHCWPENQYAALDLFLCGKPGKPQAACDFLIQKFEADSHELKVVERGLR